MEVEAKPPSGVKVSLESALPLPLPFLLDLFMRGAGASYVAAVMSVRNSSSCSVDEVFIGVVYMHTVYIVAVVVIVVYQY